MFDEKKREALDFINDKKINIPEDNELQILIHINEYLGNRIITYSKLYYDIAIIVASSVALTVLYAIANVRLILFFAVPVIILLGHIFYMYLTLRVIDFEWYIINKYKNHNFNNIPEVVQKIGIFRDLFNEDKHAKGIFYLCKWVLYSGGYIFSLVIALILNFNKPITIPGINWNINVWWSLFVFIPLTIVYALVINILRKKFIYYSVEIKKIIKNEKMKKILN